MNETIANNTCQKVLEESFGAVVEGWVDGCPSMLLQGTSKEVGIVLDIEGTSQQHPYSHARIMVHNMDDLQALEDSEEWQALRDTLESHGYADLYLVDMTETSKITEGRSVADIMKKI